MLWTRKGKASSTIEFSNNLLEIILSGHMQGAKILLQCRGNLCLRNGLFSGDGYMMPGVRDADGDNNNDEVEEVATGSRGRMSKNAAHSPTSYQ